MENNFILIFGDTAVSKDEIVYFCKSSSQHTYSTEYFINVVLKNNTTLKVSFYQNLDARDKEFEKIVNEMNKWRMVK